MNQAIQLDWLEKLVIHFPEMERPRKNMIEIAGYPSRENVNSNLLAFYLNEKEDHQMGQLFMGSLLELMQEKSENGSLADQDLFATTYRVERESDFIDILLQAEEEESGNCPWAIVIENKIHHGLENNLKKYLQSVVASQKFGVLLSLHTEKDKRKLSFELEGKTFSFLNITHAELVRRVRQKLPDYFEKADDRHLLFLKEYFNNIESHYKTEKPDTEMEQTLKTVQMHKGNIEQLNKTLEDLQSYVLDRLKKVFEQFNFAPKNDYLSKSKTYYSTEAEERRRGVGCLRFWVNVERLLMDNEFSIYLELCGEGVKHGEVIKAALEKEGFPWGTKLVIGNGKGQSHFHLAFNKADLPPGTSFDEGLAEIISLFFIKRYGDKSMVDLCLQELRNLQVE